MKFSNYLKVICLLSVIFLCVVSSVYTQQNLQAWHVQGQTFLVWEHSQATPPETYQIYVSLESFNSISDANLIGRVYSDNGANTRIHKYVPDAHWLLPNNAGLFEVGTNQSYFVVTPHEEGTAYYAVVPYGGGAVTSENKAGPIQETTQPVNAVIQYADEKVTIYAHWIDGRSDYNSGRPDYPIMGNEHSNGLGFNFAVWEPRGGCPTGDLPVVTVLHGGFMDLWMWTPYNLSGRHIARMDAGLLLCLDDRPLGPGPLWETNSYWFGYSNEFDRFSLKLPSDEAIIVNYTARRVWWEIDWISNNMPIDPKRVSIMGASMGGNGTLIHTQLRPDLFNSGMAFVPRRQAMDNTSDRMFGSPQQNLPTNIDGNPGVYNLFNWGWRLDNLCENDLPYTLVITGRDDNLSPWGEKPELYRETDSSKVGFALYWDQRDHFIYSKGDFNGSEHLQASYLTRFTKNQSFPGFSATDEDLSTPGRQPDPGDGSSFSGDDWGTWGGYFEWDTADIVDTAEEWAVTMWVVSQSSCPADVPAADTILAHITPRRLQQFQPQPGATYSWNFVKASTGDTLQKGIVQADSDGIITVPDLLLIKEPVRLTMTIGTPVGVEENRDVNQPTCFSLYQNYPNPFNPETMIEYQLARAVEVEISIFNLQGQKIATLVQDYRNAGSHKIIWDGKDGSCQQVASGVYLYQLKTGKFMQVKKMMLLR